MNAANSGERASVGWFNALCSGPARWPILAFCIVMSAGGAVNEGFSAWTMATPFALLMWYIAKCADAIWAKRVFAVSGKTRKKYWWTRVGVIIFWALVIAVSNSQYKNPWLYPILNEGYATALTDGRIGAYFGKNETAHLDTTTRSTSSDRENYKVVGKYAKGETFKVVGIYGDSGDLYQRVGLVLNDGRVNFNVTEQQWTEKPPQDSNKPIDKDMDELFGQKVQVSKTVQAPWAKKLGMLMLWPVFPMTALTVFMPVSPQSKP